MLESITMYTDGSCIGNPGPGGYCVVICHKNHKKILNNGFYLTTNNRMEMLAAIVGLEALKKSCSVTINTDSQYLKQGILIWIHNWKKTGWKTKNKKQVKNIDLWLRLNTILCLHKVKWKWIKGHAGNKTNEICDKLARYSAENPTLNDSGYNRKNYIKKRST